MEEMQIRELCYVDDMVIYGSTEENLQENVNITTGHTIEINLKCNTEKTKTTIKGNESLTHII